MNIRPATDADAEQIAFVVFSVLEEFGLAPDAAGTDSDLASIEGDYFARGGYFGVVDVSGEIVATLGLFNVDGTTCELRKMYVLPAHRDRGLGTRLLEFALSTAREKGFERMVLETASPLTAAIRLYQRYGFEPLHSEHLAPRCDQAMQLRL